MKTRKEGPQGQNLTSVSMIWQAHMRLDVLAQGSPVFHSSCEGELGIALESLQGKRDLI